MITKKTVLVLGAGASKPFGLPTGKELKNDVCRLLGESNKIEHWPILSVELRQAIVKMIQ